jgi:hypothetical protein
MKTIAATLFFGLLSAQSAMAAECFSYTDYENVNNNTVACIGRVANQAEPVAAGAYQIAILQSSYLNGNEYAAAV